MNPFLLNSCDSKTNLTLNPLQTPSCRAASTDILDPFLLLLPISHRLRQVFRTTSCILTELLYVCSSWLSCFCSANNFENYQCMIVWKITVKKILLFLRGYTVKDNFFSTKLHQSRTLDGCHGALSNNLYLLNFRPLLFFWLGGADII